jgi:cytochrome P450/NADPH-cytochrome P450 reductase
MYATPEKIPEPPGLPFLGNLRTVDPTSPSASLLALGEQYGMYTGKGRGIDRIQLTSLGEIFRLRFPGRSSIVIGSQALIDEACDEKRFEKCIGAGLQVCTSSLVY